MVTILLVLLLFIVARFFNQFIKDHFKAIALVALSLSMIIYIVLPQFEIVTKGFLGLAFFVIVMFASTFKNGSQTYNSLMRIRAEYSILGFITLIPHALMYLIDTFGFYEWFGVLAFIVMIPLFVTSFLSIRKKMNPNSWKKLHKFSYIAYLLTYIHLMVIGESEHLIVYTVLFGVYTLVKSYALVFEKSNVTLRVLASLGLTAVFVLVSYKAFFKEFELPVKEVESVVVAADVSNTTETNENTEETENTDSASTQNSTDAYADGTYTGYGTGFKNLTVELDVTIENDDVVSIDVVQNGSTSPHKGINFSQVALDLAEEMVAIDSADVDAVSGATKTSNGMIEAMLDALKQAMN